MDVAAAAVQLDRFAQRAGVPVVEIGCGQRDVPQRRDLEGAFDSKAFRHRTAEIRRENAREVASGVRQWAEDVPTADTKVVRGRTYADVVEAPVDDIAVAIAHGSEVRDPPGGGIRQLGLLMAVRAADVRRAARTIVEEMCAEQSETADVVRVEIVPRIQRRIGRARVLAPEAVPRRVVGDERGLV